MPLVEEYVVEEADSSTTETVVSRWASTSDDVPGASLIALTESFRRGQRLERSSSILRLADRVASSLARSEQPDVEAWADRLAGDVADADD